MARVLAEGEALVEVGVMGLRAPDGSITENVKLFRIVSAQDVKLFRIVSAQDVSPKTGLTRGEEQACEDIAAVLAEKFGQYIRDSRKAVAK